MIMKHLYSFIFIMTSFMMNAQNVLTPEMLIGLNRVSAASFSPTGEYILYSISQVDYKTEKNNSDLYIYSLSSGTSKQLTNTPDAEYNPVWFSAKEILFFSRKTGKQVLYAVDVIGVERMVSNSADLEEVNEFTYDAVNKRLITLQSTKVKETVNDVYSDLPNANARVENSLMYRHWSSYDDYTVQKLYAYSFDGKSLGAPILLTIDDFPAATPPFGGLDQIALNPTNSSIFFSTKKLKGTDFAVSTNSELFELKGGTELEITSKLNLKGYDLHPQFSSQGNLAWMNMERAGFEADKVNILLLDGNNGYRNLTEKFYYSVDDFRWNGDGTRIYFIATIEATKQLFMLEVKSSRITQLTVGDHDYTSLAVFNDRIVATRTTLIHPADLFMIDYTQNKAGKVFTSITQVTTANPFWDKLDLPTVEKHWVETTDGKKMLVWTLIPPNAKVGEEFPALLYCQGGPQSAVSQFFSYRWNLCLMASQGYVVVAPNRRGLPGFGQEWNDAISGDWGGQPIKDYLSATDYAAKLSYVNADKMGAVGASYGGYSVYMLAGLHEKRFKTFISHCGLFNLESWYGTTEELFFANWEHGGPYWLADNKMNYEKNSPHKLVDKWDTPMLVIHGGVDFRVPESEGMQAFQVAQLKGLKSRFLYFPKEGHWVVRPQNSLLWQREFFKWLSEDLQ